MSKTFHLSAHLLAGYLLQQMERSRQRALHLNQISRSVVGKAPDAAVDLVLLARGIREECDAAADELNVLIAAINDGSMPDRLNIARLFGDLKR